MTDRSRPRRRSATMNRVIPRQRHATHRNNDTRCTGAFFTQWNVTARRGSCDVAPHARLSSLHSAVCTTVTRHAVADGGTKIAHLFAHHGRRPCKSKETRRCKAMKRRTIKAKKRVRIGTCPKQWNVTGAPTQHRRQQQLHLQGFTQRRLHALAPPSRIGPDGPVARPLSSSRRPRYPAAMSRIHPLRRVAPA